MTSESGPAAGGSTNAPSAGALQITNLYAGETVTLPVTIGYRVTGPAIDAAAGYRLRVQADTHTLELPITSQTGTVTVPVDKYFAGQRDLTFTLLGPGNTPLNNPASVVVVRNVLIIGPK